MSQNETAELLRTLCEVYKPSAVGIWLCTSQTAFGGLTAIEMIEQDRMDEVLAATARLRDGAFG